MATADEIRAWAREQGMTVSDKGRLSATVRAAYEAATGDLGDIEDLAPEPAPVPDVAPDAEATFRPADKADPRPARTRQPKGRKTTHAPTAAVMADIEGKTGFMLSMPAMAWASRDPLCGSVAVQQVPAISKALARLFAQSPEIVEWFTGKGGNFMAWLDLAAACQPVLMTVIGHHVTHTIGDQPQEQYAVPADQYAA